MTAFDPSEYDDAGQWTGTCDECGTNHEGHAPGTIGGQMRCLRAQAVTLGASHLVDQIDAGQRDLAARRDQILRDLDLIPPDRSSSGE
jgi:hypothetical protein